MKAEAPTVVDLYVNGSPARFEGDPGMPLLWYLRDGIGLTGTKYGCWRGFCGSCSVLVDGRLRRSCRVTMQSLQGRRVLTIEGLGQDGLHPVQEAWLAEDVAQCGYCQAGQILAAVDLLTRIPEPTPSDVESITNLCRCGTYVRVRKAVARAAASMRADRDASAGKQAP